MKFFPVSIVILLILPFVIAVPPIANEFYGSITDKGAAVGSGKIIAIAGSNVSCGNFTIVYSGYYGLLSCLGDDPYTARVEGAVTGQRINFSLNGAWLVVVSGSPYWNAAYFTRVDLSTRAVCGDSYCDYNQGESCSTCMFDCGLCENATINVSQNVTPGAGGGGGAGAGGGIIGAGAAVGLAPECTENWRCGDWKPKKCPVNETQGRKCLDINNCDTAKSKPNETRHCNYLPTCSDLVLNGDETDIDCGGEVCPKCELDKKCRADSDCLSNACDPYRLVCIEPTEPKMPEIREPKMPQFISPDIIPCGKIFPWLLFIILLLLAASVLMLAEMYLLYLRYYNMNYKKLTRVNQLKEEIRVRRRARWIAMAIFAADVALSLYLYINNGCPQYSSLTAFFIVVTIVVVFFLLYRLLMRFEYEEEKSHKLLSSMLQGHQTKMSEILQIENKQLGIYEKEILASMEISREAIKDMSDLEKIYENFVPLQEKLMAIVDTRLKKQPVDKLQTELSDMIGELVKNTQFEASLASSSSLLTLFGKLKLLKDRYLKRDQIAEDLEKTISYLTGNEVKGEE